MHRLRRDGKIEFLFPRPPWVNGQIVLIENYLRKNSISVNTNVGSLPKSRLLFTNQLNPQSPQIHPPQLGHISPVGATRLQRVLVDLHDRRSHPGRFSQTPGVMAEHPDADTRHRK